MTCFRRKRMHSILTATISSVSCYLPTIHLIQCPGLSPDSLVQQNKNACPLIAHRVAHLPQSKPEYRNRRHSGGGKCSQCRHAFPIHGDTGAININRRISVMSSVFTGFPLRGLLRQPFPGEQLLFCPFPSV